MGYSTTEMEVAEAKQMTSGWEVVAATKLSYFVFPEWRKRVIKAELKDDGNTVFFTLANNEFVTVEKLKKPAPA